jgi:hypothetical protein
MMEIHGHGRSLVKAADPLAAPGIYLYYFHSKTPLYNDIFFILWDAVIPRVFQYVCPSLVVKCQKDLKTPLLLEFTW